MRCLFLLLLAFAAFLSAPIQAATTYSVYNNSKTGIDIDVLLAWEDIPFDRRGFYPVVVRIKNSSDRDGRWTVSSESSSYNGRDSTNLTREASLEVPAGETRSFKLLFPLSYTQNYNTLNINISGTGVSDFANFSRNANNRSSGKLLHFGGVSEDLYTEVGNLLDNKIDRLGDEVHFTGIDPGLAPADWRAYLTFDTLYFSQDSWDTMAPPARRAILDWVSTGGELRLLVEDDNFSRDISDIPNGERMRPVGIGRVSLYSGDIDNLRRDLNHTAQYSRNRNGETTQETRIAIFDLNFSSFFNYRHQLEPRNSFERPIPGKGKQNPFEVAMEKAKWPEDSFFNNAIKIESVNFSIIILSVIAFGIIVGPVNFFYLAKGRNRWRVFITIPVISMIFCVLIVASIILSDGFGGAGLTSRLVLIDPDRKMKVNVQDETSVTGILMSGDFEVPATSTIQFMGAKLPDSPISQSGQFNQYKDEFSGDYYQSRRLQKNRLIDVTPSREAMILQGTPEVPELVSNLQASCQTIFFSDEKGNFWKVENLGVGRSGKAVKASRREFIEWWGERQKIGGSPGLFEDYRGFAGRSGWFYATAEPVKDAYPETLTSVNWDNHQTIIAGPLVIKEAN